VAAVDDVVTSSAVCASEFGREDGGGEKESWSATRKRSVKGVEVSVTRYRAVQVYLRQRTSV